MTTILKIAVNLGENFLSCIIVAYYDLALDEDFIKFLIENKLWEIFKFIFAFDKNYYGIREDDDSVKVSLRRFFSMVMLYTKEEEELNLLKYLCKWEVHMNENFLLALV